MSESNPLNRTKVSEREQPDTGTETAENGLTKARIQAISESINGGDVIKANNLLNNMPHADGVEVVAALPDNVIATAAQQIAEHSNSVGGAYGSIDSLNGFGDTFKNDPRLMSQPAITEAYAKVIASGNVQPGHIANIFRNPNLNIDAIKADPAARAGMVEVASFYLKETRDGNLISPMLRDIEMFDLTKEELAQIGESVKDNARAYEALFHKFGA